jgi:cell wall-associated NlpC family hydrolase
VQRLLRVVLCGAVAIGVFLPGTAALADPTPEDVQQQLDQQHNALESIIEDYNRIGEELKATQASAAALGAKIAPLQGNVDAAQADVGKIAAMAYKKGGDLATTNALLSGSVGSVVGKMESMERIARVRQREVSSFTQTKREFDVEKKRVDDLLATQLQQHKQLTDRKATIEAEINRLDGVERRLGLRANVQVSTNAPPAPSGSGKGAIAARFAYAQIGKMYQYAAAGPMTFDCSGLTMMAWKQAGVNLPHNARMQYNNTAKVGRGNLQPGDLVYYNGLGHVGIYVGNDTIIHASRPGKPIAAVSINSSGTPYGYSRPG